MKTVTQFLTFILLLGAFSAVKANNLTITNVSLTGATSTTIQVQYNMFWENSWRDLENWDATWVFVKYSTNNGATWAHANMSTSGHVAGTSTPTATIQIPQDNLGAFIYRSSVSSGTFTITNQQLQWNFTANGLNQSQASSATIRVFGVEMVYVPQGEYYLGDGVNNTGTATPSTNAFRRNDDNVATYIGSGLSEPIYQPLNTTITFRINGLTGVDLNNDGIISTWSTDAPDYPTGYRHFYCMKQELSQGQYCDFLNTLSYDQQSIRVFNVTNVVGQNAHNGSTTASSRFTIFVLTAGSSPSLPRVYTATRPDRACNYMNWPDAAAYLDWSGLRPMTEFEFEKAIRGPQPPVQGEYSWGNTSFTAVTGITAGVENGTEIATNTTSMYHNGYSQSVSGGDGAFSLSPVRTGMFAKSATTRIQSGASYYGILDMTGNLNEFVVGLHGVPGRSFTGLHGNGALFTNGAADVSYWPGINGNNSATVANTTFGGVTGITNSSGIMWKEDSGTVGTSTIYPVSLRYSWTSTSTTYHSTRHAYRGFRGVKSNL